jgi:lipid-A-disaccharide synthase
MRRYVDRVMAVLPFEPEALRKLGGPPTTYVGHPLVEQIDRLRPNAEEAARRAAPPPVLVVLPGSRRGELRRLMPVFGEALALLAKDRPPFEVVVPTLPHLRAMVSDMALGWPVTPRIVDTADERQAAFRIARAALAKSGTVTLELALSGVPMVTAYKVAAFEAAGAWLLLRISSAILANLVLGENAIPEFLQYRCTPDRLAAATAAIMDEGEPRARQLAAFAKLDAIMETGGRTPRERAADVVMETLKA